MLLNNIFRYNVHVCIHCKPYAKVGSSAIRNFVAPKGRRVSVSMGWLELTGLGGGGFAALSNTPHLLNESLY